MIQNNELSDRPCRKISFPAVTVRNPTLFCSLMQAWANHH